MKLNNGAEVLKKVGDKVLALFYGEYVVWTVSDSGEAFWGHYFKDDLEAAAKYFESVAKYNLFEVVK